MSAALRRRPKQYVVAKDVASPLEACIRRQHGRRVLVAPPHELNEQRGAGPATMR
jgi:hypothetical protein